MYHLLSQCLERGKFIFHGTMAFENTQNKCETHIEKRHILVQVNTFIPDCQALIFQNSVQPPLPLLVLETVPSSRLDGWMQWGFAAKTVRCHPSEIYEIREVAENTTIFVLKSLYEWITQNITWRKILGETLTTFLPCSFNSPNYWWKKSTGPDFLKHP